MKVSLVIPIYNESSIINEAIVTFSGYMRKNFDDWELIFSNDGSTDGCEKTVLEAAEKEPRIRLAGYPVNQGKGCAVRCGILSAEGDYIVFTDCDNAYGEDAVGRMFKMLADTGDDMIIGSRNLTKDGYEDYTFIRRIASKTYIKIIALAAGFKLSDSQSGIKGFRREAARKIFNNCEVNRFAFDLEAILIAQKAGFKITEMPVKVINHRESKVRILRDSVKMLSDLRKMKKRIKKLELK